LGKSVHRSRPGRGQISGFGLPLTAVTKNQIKKIDLPPNSATDSTRGGTW